MTSGREITPPPGFSAAAKTTTMFAVTTLENTPLAYRASTSTNPNPVISPAFVEANYETLDEDYDEEREMEPRLEPARAVTPPLRAASPRVRKRRERIVRFEETQNKGERRVKRNIKGERPSKEESRGNGGQNVNLPSLLAAHIGRSENGQPLQSSLTSAYGGQPMYAFPNIPAYANPNPMGLFSNPLGSVTPFVRWIEDYPLPDGLEMPSHIDLPLTYKGLMEKMYTWVKAREIQEAINSMQLSHLVKGIKKEKEKSTGTPLGEGKKDKSTAPVEAPILMISREEYATKNTVLESMAYKVEIMFPPVTRVNNAPVIIEAAVFGRKVGRVYMDSESTCEVIYKHFFEKLNPTIKATRVNMKTPLVGFSGKRSWSIGEVPLEIKIGEHTLSRIETLNFIIVKSDSPHNMMLGRTTMQKIGIVVSTIHEAIKFHTKKGVGTVLSVGEDGEETKKARRTLTISKERVPNSDDTEEKIIVNDKYPEQMTHADMIGIPRTIMVDGKPFNTEHKLNEGRSLLLWENPFGLKNTGATYQRLVDKVFSKQIRRNLKAYVDDMVIKSTSEEGLLSDIQEPFERFWSINMKLNPKKCSFGVEEDPFLGHLITKQGIKANLSKIKEVTEAERSLPFFKVLKSCKGKKRIHWTSKANKAFKEMKKFIQALPMLTAPRAGETLTRVLQGAELNYPTLEKLILALVHSVKRLRRYFQAHTIIDRTGEHDIVFLKRDERETPADFLPEIPFNESEKKVKEKEVSDPSNEWKLYTDGASSFDGAGLGLMLIDVAGKEYTYALRFEFETTNNEAEYEALLVGLRIAQEMEITKVAIFLDSQLVPSMYMDAEKAIQDCDRCKEQSAIRKAGVDGAIAVGSTWPFSHWGIQILRPLPMALGVPWIISSKEENHFKEGTFEDFYKGLKITQTFSPITEHMEIMHYIEKQLVQSQQSWVDNLAKELWVHRTLLRNNQEETPFSLTYGSEAVVPIVEATDDRGRTQGTTKKGKEIALIEKVHYRNKLRKYYNTRNNYSNYIVGDFILFSTSSQEQQGPHMINEVHKDGFYTLVNVADHSLIQKAKGTSLYKFYM
ncbi:reverse transcriptase domain-containing protein [Tanacetum coccineum]